MSNATLACPEPETFRHEALLYAGAEGFVAGTVPFILDGVAAGEPVFVVVGQEKINLLRANLSGDAKAVQFVDTADVGRNPARIIPAWRDFVDANEGRRLRGIGEPIWQGRSSAELVECQRHESAATAVDRPAANQIGRYCFCRMRASAHVLRNMLGRREPFIRTTRPYPVLARRLGCRA